MAKKKEEKLKLKLGERGRKKEKSNPSEWKCPRSKSNYRLQMTISNKNVKILHVREESRSAKIDLISSLLSFLVTAARRVPAEKETTHQLRVPNSMKKARARCECQLITTVNIFLFFKNFSSPDSIYIFLARSDFLVRQRWRESLGKVGKFEFVFRLLQMRRIARNYYYFHISSRDNHKNFASTAS